MFTSILSLWTRISSLLVHQLRCKITKHQSASTCFGPATSLWVNLHFKHKVNCFYYINLWLSSYVSLQLYIEATEKQSFNKCSSTQTCPFLRGCLFEACLRWAPMTPSKYLHELYVFVRLIKMNKWDYHISKSEFDTVWVVWVDGFTPLLSTLRFMFESPDAWRWLVL